MKHAKFDTAENVADFLNESPARKMQGICFSLNDYKYHLFYTESVCYVLDEETCCEEDDEE